MANEPSMDESLKEGHYARKQIFCKSWLISWSHQSRFKLALELAHEFRGKRVLDYGCGDGTFLTLLLKSADAPAKAVGAEVDQKQIVDCRTRLANWPQLSFVAVPDLDLPEYAGQFDAIVCTEVLEHVVGREVALDRFQRLLAPGGRLIISVPVETGFSLVIKQSARTIAGWRGLGDYPGMSPYTWNDFFASIVAGDNQHMVRPIHGVETGQPFHDHKGFNWRVLRKEVAARFELERTLTSPVAWLGSLFASQVWFLARKKRA